MEISLYEIISLFLALLAIIISGIAIIISNSANKKSYLVQKEANDLQKCISDLAQKQIVEMEESQKRSNCILTLNLQDNGMHSFDIHNNSKVSAHDVNMEIIKGDLPISDAKQLEHFVPLKILHPNQTIGFKVNRRLSSPASHEVKLEWKDPDGSSRSKIFILRYD